MRERETKTKFLKEYSSQRVTFVNAEFFKSKLQQSRQSKVNLCGRETYGRQQLTKKAAVTDERCERTEGSVGQLTNNAAEKLKKGAKLHPANFHV